MVAVALSLQAALTTAATAQGGGVVAGVVLDSATRAPVAGAQVVIENTTLGAVTDDRGRFQIQGVRGTTTTATARRIGYALQRRTVSAGDSAVQFLLAPRAANLDEVVVTGTQGGAARRELGNAVTQVNAAQVLQIAPVQDFQQLLSGRAPNVTVMPGSGAVGTGAKIRVRGTSSLGLTQDPLIYVDGVRVDNDQATGPENQAFGSSTISRWNDIDPEDIDHIDILKGPAAATIYGTEAQNGVINIVTKQGSSSGTRYGFTIRQGTNFLMDPEDKFPTNYQLVGDEVRTIDYAQLRDAYGRDFFRNGRYQKYHGSVSGGSGAFQYYLAGVRELSGGAERNNDLSRTAGRANLTANISDKFRVSSSLNYLTGRTNLSAEAGYGGTVWSTVLMDPANLDDPLRHGFYSGTPDAYNQLYHFNQDINRFTGGVTIAHQPVSWFSHRFTFGADQSTYTDVEMAVRIDSLQSFFDTDALGYRFQGDNNVGLRTYDYAASARFNASPSISLETSAGAQYYRRRTERTLVSGSVFAAPGQTSIDALTSRDAPSSDLIENSSLGFYGQEQIGWLDRRFLTVGLRTDDNSTFGRDFDRAYYPKASLSWVINEEPFWRLDFVNSLRLRAAYGQTGQQPGFGQAERTLISVTGPSDAPAVTAQNLGNADLGPERGKETEVGFDAGLLNERLAFEFTWYHKTTTDAILAREIAPSVGFDTTQYVNAGKVTNSGIELIARGTPVRRENFEWTAQFAIATSKNRIVDLGLGGLNTISAGQFREHREGYPVGSWFLKKVVSAQLDADGTAINVLCDSLGTPADCANAPTVFYGTSIPKREGSISNTFTLWKNLRLYSLVDFQRGQRKLDGNLRVRCNLELGGRCRQVFFPQEYDPIEIAQIQGGNDYPGNLIKNASFWKLREVSLSYTLPDKWAGAFRARSATLTIAGRNLHTWTDYTGLEPEAFFLSGSRGEGNVAWEQTVLPQLSSFIATVDLEF